VRKGRCLLGNRQKKPSRIEVPTINSGEKTKEGGMKKREKQASTETGGRKRLDLWKPRKGAQAGASLPSRRKEENTYDRARKSDAKNDPHSCAGSRNRGIP